MRAVVIVLAVPALAASCAEPSATGEQHGRIGLYGGGALTPPVEPRVLVYLPDTTLTCQSEREVDGCLVRRECEDRSPQLFSAGEIELTTEPATRVPSGQQGLTHAAEFSAGDTIGLTAQGQSIPAFAASTTAPSQAVITSKFDSSAPIGGDLMLTWTGVNEGTVHVLGQAGVDGRFNFLSCALDASSGAGAVSLAALAAFGGGLIRIHTAKTVEIVVDNWTIDFSVGFDSIWDDGTLAQGLVRTQ